MVVKVKQTGLGQDVVESEKIKDEGNLQTLPSKKSIYFKNRLFFIYLLNVKVMNTCVNVKTL